jgi:hypothetical protein
VGFDRAPAYTVGMSSRKVTLPSGLLASLCVLWLFPAGAAARQADRTEVTAAGERYRAGLFHRWILGRHYRHLWTAPIDVQVLDLGRFAGGLEPLRVGGGQQTRSLRFQGADGREYAFRSVDKDPSPVLDSLLRETIVDDLVQDGISAAHPYGALVAPRLLDAAGVLHVTPQLRIMPDDPALGEFREDFAGMLGMIEERPNESDDEDASFAGARRVIASETLTDRLERGPDDLVDARAFLTARLVDVFLGDWDRHRGQWRWATYDEDEPRSWLPVPTDRDQAFSKFDGLATRIVSLYMPQFVRFEEQYPDLTRLHWNGRALDRWFLSGLARPVWDSIGGWLVERLDDSVIDEAVHQLPPEIYALNGEELARTLKARRDRLPGAVDEFYRLLAHKVDIRLTNEDEIVTVDRSVPDVVRVSAGLPDAPAPHFDRRFLADETEEIRIYAAGGDDRVVFLGNGAGLVRVIGGEGDDVFEVGGDGRDVRLYDSEGNNRTSGPNAPSIDSRHFEEWVWTEEDRDQPRDWGRRAQPIFWTSYSSDLGLFLGGGARLLGYGFRKRPYASAFDLRAGFAPVLRKGRLEIEGRMLRENSPTYWTLGARISRLDVIHYYGAGNDSEPSGDEEFHRVDQTAASVRLGLGVAPSPGLDLSAGILVERLSTRDGAGRFYGSLGPLYGGGEFIQAGASARLDWDPTISSASTANRLRFSVEGTVFPGMFDVDRTVGRGSGEVSVLLAPSPSPVISLALRARGVEVWGRAPWHQFAFLGGPESLRGWDEQRFAGDRALTGRAEVRLRFWRPRVVVPVSSGLFGFGDAGRVYLDGATPGGWHTSAGGGLWLQPVLQPYIFQAGVAFSEEATKLFVMLGLPY